MESRSSTAFTTWIAATSASKKSCAASAHRFGGWETSSIPSAKWSRWKDKVSKPCWQASDGAGAIMPAEDHLLREQLTELLRGGEAHANIATALEGFPADKRAVKLAGSPHS